MILVVLLQPFETRVAVTGVTCAPILPSNGKVPLISPLRYAQVFETGLLKRCQQYFVAAINFTSFVSFVRESEFYDVKSFQTNLDIFAKNRVCSRMTKSLCCALLPIPVLHWSSVVLLPLTPRIIYSLSNFVPSSKSRISLQKLEKWIRSCLFR